MAEIKKAEDLIGRFIDFDALGDAAPVAVSDGKGGVSIMTAEKYGELKKRREAKRGRADNKK